MILGWRPRGRLIAAAATTATVVVVAVVIAMLGSPPRARPSAAPPPSATLVASMSASPSPSASPSRRPSPSVTPHPASGLTALQRAGQRIIYSYPGLTPPPSLLQHIRDGQAAGVIFFRENVASTAQIAGVIAQLRQAQGDSPVRAPLLLMTDQEGGQVRRLPGQPDLSAKQVGSSANPQVEARAAGAGAADTLRSVGMNVNLAPVLDVYTTPGNFIDRLQRSYSSDTNTVATLAAQFITSQQAAGVAATAKHFPGLGSAATGQNTDNGPVTVTSDLSTLRAHDEATYPAAVAAGVKLVMVSWAVYPALDRASPAGLSRVVVQSELRARLHFTGVTITDAMEAGALKAYGTPARLAVLAAQAGMDLILCSARDVRQGESAAAGLADGLAAGQFDPAAFNAALNRVSALRASLP